MKTKRLTNFDGYKFALYPLILAVLIVYSIFDVGLDPTIIWTEKFWIELALKYLIQFAWIYFGIPDGKNKGGLIKDFVDIKNTLKKTVSLLKDKGLLLSFRAFVKEDFIKRRSEFIDDVLFQNGIDKKIYDHDLRYIRKHREELALDLFQVIIIKQLKKGHFDFPQIDYNTFLSVHEVKDQLHQGEYRESMRIIKDMLPKLLLTFITLALSSSMAISGQAEIGQALWGVAVNLGLSITSYAVAYRTGLKIMEDYGSVFNFRNNYLHTFIEQLENGKFIPDLSEYEKIEVIEEKEDKKI